MAAPAQPRSILRGHKAQVHATVFIGGNERLVTGDADGFIVVWDLTVMRPRAVWRAHANAILGACGWGTDKIITHGRDNKMIVWRLGVDDEASMNTSLPLDEAAEQRRQPWMLHMLEVNTMNFCSFSSCPLDPSSSEGNTELWIAVPNTLQSEAIDIFHLPSQQRRYTVKLGDNNGMVMAVSLFSKASKLTLAAGYENGMAVVAQLRDGDGSWVVRYRSQPHSQPILSLDVTPRKDCFFTSGADAIIAKHPIPASNSPDPAEIFPLSTGAAADSPGATRPQGTPAQPISLLSTALASQPSPNRAQLPAKAEEIPTEPIKIVNTKHAGQQGIRVRSDGRIFATAGWDARVRVYSVKTMKELAVLKWHQVGCYAVGFADISPEGGVSGGNNQGGLQGAPEGENQKTQSGNGHTGQVTLVPKLVELTVKESRIQKVKEAHWIAAGSKDGKVSLWDIY